MTASPDNLHLLAHRAQLHARTEDDWWDNALETALAAVSATRHPASYRAVGEAALARLIRWQREGAPRRVSADTAALALTAAAAADLARRDRAAERDAIAAVDDLAGRGGAAAPPLHLALCAWALDRLAPDREQSPWVAIRGHSSDGGGRVAGLEGPLRTLIRTLAAPSFDASALVRALLGEVPISPGTEDAAVLLWVMTAAIERCAGDIDARDAGMRALTDRRSELAQRLAQEVSAQTFLPPDVGEFDPDEEFDLRPVTYLSPTEALLVDISLASSEPEDPWLRFEEAKALFGTKGEAAERRLATNSAALLFVSSLLCGALVGVSLALGEIQANIAVWAGVAATMAGSLAATTVIYSRERSGLVQALGMLCATLGLVAGVVVLNRALAHPVVGDVGGFVVGALVGVLAALVWSVVVRTSND